MAEDDAYQRALAAARKREWEDEKVKRGMQEREEKDERAKEAEEREEEMHGKRGEAKKRILNDAGLPEHAIKGLLGLHDETAHYRDSGNKFTIDDTEIIASLFQRGLIRPGTEWAHVNMGHIGRWRKKIIVEGRGEKGGADPERIAEDALFSHLVRTGDLTKVYRFAGKNKWSMKKDNRVVRLGIRYAQKHHTESDDEALADSLGKMNFFPNVIEEIVRRRNEEWRLPRPEQKPAGKKGVELRPAEEYEDLFLKLLSDGKDIPALLERAKKSRIEVSEDFIVGLGHKFALKSGHTTEEEVREQLPKHGFEPHHIEKIVRRL